MFTQQHRKEQGKDEGSQGRWGGDPGMCRARAGVEKEEKTKANRVLGSSAGGTRQEGEKDVQMERKIDAGLFQMDRQESQTGV